MEFGALQCVPKNPLCDSCPFQRDCVAFNQNRIGQLPFKKNKIKVTDRYFNYLVFVTPQGKFDAGQYMAVWYAATGPISDRTTWLDNVGGKIGIQKIIAKSLTEAKKTGTKNFSQTLKNQLTNLSYKLKSNGYNFAKEGGKETLQENAQQAGEFL